MKKLVTMFVMMMTILAVSCNNETTTSGGEKNESTAVKKDIPESFGVRFNANGTTTGNLTPISTTIDSFKEDFILCATTQYGTAHYAAITKNNVILKTGGVEVTGAATFLGNADYTLTLTVTKIGETASATFTYTFKAASS